MKRTVKYSSIIVAALFAAAPVALNHSSLVKAEQTPAPAIGQERKGAADQNQNKDGQQDSSAEKKDDPKGTKQGEQPASGEKKGTNDQNKGTAAGKDIGSNQGNKDTDAEPWSNAQEITMKYDSAAMKKATKIKWDDNLTYDDATDYMTDVGDNNIQFWAGKEKINNDNFEPSLSCPMKKPNDTLPQEAKVTLNYFLKDSASLNPNTWYKWKIDEVENFDAKGYADRFHFHNINKDTSYVYEKTDDQGKLPPIDKYNNSDKCFKDGITFEISMDSDAINIPGYERINAVDKKVPNAFKISRQYNSEAINKASKVKWDANLTSEALEDYIRDVGAQNVTFMVNNEKVQPEDITFGEQNTDSGEDHSLKPGDSVKIYYSMDATLKPNTWYSWEISNSKFQMVQIPLTLKDQIYFYQNGTTRTLYEKTDKDGNLPRSFYNGGEEDYDNAYLDHTFTFTVSTDPDAVDISKYEENNSSDNNDDNYVPSNDDDVTPATPSTDDSQKSTPTKTDDSKKSQKPAKNNSAKHNTSASSSNKAAIPAPTYTVKHTALVYDRHGKRVKTSSKRFILKRKNGKIKVLDHGKVYKIRGRKYYRIGKNMFIKVANVSVQAPAKRVALKGTAKVAKLRRLRFYNANGRHVKKTAKKRNFRFDRKKTIKGKLYYRVKGTNLWVRANQFKLHK